MPWADPSGNRVDLEPSTEDDLVRLEELGGTAQLLELYASCRSIDLPDAGNGYFVHIVDTIVMDIQRGAPTRTIGTHELDVLPFGSDGGGGRFCFDPKSGAVYLLPPGLVEDHVYESDSDAFRRFAESVAGFLQVLLARCEHPLDA